MLSIRVDTVYTGTLVGRVPSLAVPGDEPTPFPHRYPCPVFFLSLNLIMFNPNQRNVIGTS